MGNDIIVLIVVEAFAVIAMSLKINLSCVLVKFTAEFTAFLRKVSFAVNLAYIKSVKVKDKYFSVNKYYLEQEFGESYVFWIALIKTHILCNYLI
ncbi:uncharacterized protein LOC113300037 isoform X2 [Papaver somniferum]|uniref:uncharacterized protein LOC113300037 isoform X2 n=1 Tax=Papaver somniferum TaxID=3469 RepID=UPI000E6FDE5D|nr:uncharacterized protein LOC113300037 isoform X2 [Papaver somniferum]